MLNIEHYIGSAQMRESAERVKGEILKKQWEQATAYAHNAGVVIECGCGRSRAMELMFRCYFCGLFFCDICAKGHFGELDIHDTL
jgi:hypothetical protein